MKFYTEEITVLKNGTTAAAINEKTSELEAVSAFHAAMASALVNQDVVSIHCEAKNNLGGVYKSDTWTTPVHSETE